MDWIARLHLNHQRAVAAIITVVTLAALAGMGRLKLDGDPRTLFRSDSEENRRLESFYVDFGPDDQDVILIVQGDDMLSRPAIKALRTATADLKQVEGVGGVYGLLDVRRPGPIPLRLIPEDDDPPSRWERLPADAAANPMARGQSLSDDRRTTIVSVRLAGNPDTAETQRLSEKIDRIAEARLTAAGLSYRIAGHPAIRIATLQTLRSEVSKFALLGAGISAVIAMFVFRKPRVLIIAMSGPAIGVLWTLGLMGCAGVSIDPLLVVLPTLLFVVAFTDAVHVIHDVRAGRQAGLGARQAAAAAARRIGPACALTALTTMAGFGSLAVAEIGSIRKFGLVCAGGTAVAALAVQLVVPWLTASRLGRDLSTTDAEASRSMMMSGLSRFYGKMLEAPQIVAAAAVISTAYCFATSLELKSDLRWTESLPEGIHVVEATRTCDEAFGGSMFAQVVVEWPADVLIRSERLYGALERVHGALSEETRFRNPVSLLTLLQSITKSGGDLADATDYLPRMPPGLLTRFLRQDLRRTAVAVHVPDAGAAEMTPQFAALEGRLEQVRREYPGFQFHLTGTVVVAARNIYRIIDDLARALTLAGAVIFIMMCVLFRSAFLAVLSLVPNVFPQAVTTAVLVWVGEPLTVTSVLTFALCLGLSVDDTVHFLMRFLEERRRGPSLRDAVARTFDAVGGTMIVTSLVLIGGFAAMLVSTMPGIRMFAILSCLTLCAAIVGDLVMLPSLILAFPRASRGPVNRATREESSDLASEAVAFASADRPGEKPDNAE